MMCRSPPEDAAGVQEWHGIVDIYTSKEWENSICCHYIMEYRDNNKEKKPVLERAHINIQI